MAFFEAKQANYTSWQDAYKMARRNSLAISVKNFSDDLRAGYDFFGKTAEIIKTEIADFANQIEAEFRYIQQLANENDEKAEKYCFNELVRLGYMTE